VADRSRFTLEERIVTSTWVHERHNTWDTLDTISAKFEERFKDELKAAVTAAFGTLTLAMLRKMSHRTWRCMILCSENEGQHTDVLDA